MKNGTNSRIKGWCPGAHRPMMSGDGLVVRVRPFKGVLDTAQMLGLSALAQRFGNGFLDLTSRANLQIRGVAEPDHPALLQELDALDLIDSDPAIEAHRNILMPPIWQDGDLSDRLYSALLRHLPNLPDLPQKMGFALDTGPSGHLANGSADFRFECSDSGGLILRADGAENGRRIEKSNAMEALTELALWFDQTGGQASGRMARHLKTNALPKAWQEETPRAQSKDLAIGPLEDGQILGLPFGQVSAKSLASLALIPGAHTLHLMLGRRVWLRGARVPKIDGVLTADGPMLLTHACPGAPLCPQSTVETRALATRLARPGLHLHVSGCAKGCALPRSAEITLIGRNGRFDLVKDGAPWEEPVRRGLSAADLTDLKDLQ